MAGLRLSLLAGFWLLSAATLGAVDWGPEPEAAQGVAVKQEAPSVRPGNIIYYWFLPSARKIYSPQSLKQVIHHGNDYLWRLNVRTRMVGLVMDAGFNVSLLAPNDTVCILGDEAEVLKYAEAAGVLLPADSWIGVDWVPAANNPEIAKLREPGGRGGVFLDSKSIAGDVAGLRGKATKEQLAALYAIHGVGHEAGLKHLNDERNIKTPNFMDDGSILAANVSGGGGFLMNGTMVEASKATPIAELFNADEFRRRGHFRLFDDPAAWERKRARGLHKGAMPTQHDAWRKMFGDTPAAAGSFCANSPKTCFL